METDILKWRMKTITILYWHLTKFEDLPYEHNTVIEYSSDTLKGCMSNITDKGYSSMIVPAGDNVTLYIGKYKMTQR